MSPHVSADLRWLRAVVVAGLAGGLGAGAHVAAGGRLPSVPVVVVVLAALVVATAASLGRPASYRRLAVLVGGGQAAVHACLTATAGHGAAHGHVAAAPRASVAPAAGATGGTGGTRRDNALDQLAAATPGEGPTGAVEGPATGLSHAGQHLLADLTGTTLLMTLLHLAAAGVVAAWLFAGEQALWSLVVLLGAWLGARLVRPSYAGPTEILPIRGRPGATAAPAGPRRERRFAVSGPSGRRGPPLLRATLTTSTA